MPTRIKNVILHQLLALLWVLVLKYDYFVLFCLSDIFYDLKCIRLPFLRSIMPYNPTQRLSDWLNMCTDENSSRICYTHFDLLSVCNNGSNGCYKHADWSSGNGSSAVNTGLHPHWLSFGKEPYYTHVFVGTFLLVILMLSVTGNTIIILVFSR